MAQSNLLLLSTKFHAPRRQGGVVDRASLLRRLDDIPLHRLVLLSAPAGFGKSTLLGMWIERSGIASAWVSLETRDDDLTRFLTYVVSAIGSLHPGIGAEILEALAMTPNPQVEPLVGELINRLALLDGDILLVFDDFHRISSEEVIAAVRFLIDHGPDHLHLVLLTRSDPPIPLSRLRVSGQLLELRAADLRFTVDEAATLLTSMGVAIDHDLVEALQEKTEGWVAGLKMAALSLKGRDGSREFVNAFTGADRFVLEYLLEEVVGRQSESTQRAVAVLAILDEFNASLVEAISGIQEGQEFLEDLDRSNLFLVPLDNRREWYRYHHLFADLLGHRLHRRYADEIPELHRRAALWYDGRGMVRQAIAHADKSGRRHLLITLIEKYWLRSIHEFNGVELAHLCDIGDDHIRSHPRLAFLRCYGLYDQRNHDAMEALLPLIEKGIAGTGDLQREELTGGLALLRAIVARDRGRYAQALEQGERALRHLPDRAVDDPDYQWNLSRGMVLSFLAQGNAAIGNREESLRRIHHAWTYAQNRGDFRTLIYSLINLAYDAWAVGDIDQTFHYCDKLLAEDDRMALVAPHQRLLPRQIRATAHLLRNELDEALRWALDARTFTPQAGSPVYAAESYRVLILIYEAMGDCEGVERSLAELEEVKILISRHQWIIPMIKARSDLVRGRMSTSLSWVSAYLHQGADGIATLQSPNANERAIALLFHARILIAEEEYNQSLRVLDAVLVETTQIDRFKQGLEQLLLRAITLECLGHSDQATDMVIQAIGMAAPRGVLRPFVAEGEIMKQIIARALGNDTLPRSLSASFLRSLAMACQIDAPGVQETDDPVLIVPAEWELTERELEILNLLALGYSNRRIAERLYVSINTVKTHAANLYDKLGVNSRTEAVARASQAGVL